MTATELTQGVQFTIDQNGRLTAVVLSPELWARIVDALEESEDRDLVHAFQTRLITGPQVSGAVRWDEIKSEWQ